MVTRRAYISFITVFIGFFIFNIVTHSTGVIDNITMIILLTLLYAIKKRLHISPTLFISMASLLLLHNIGTMGHFALYGAYIGPIRFDVMMHFLAAFVGVQIIAFALQKSIKASRPVLSLLTLCVLISAGVIVEITEFGGFLYLKENDGIFNPGVGNAAEQGIGQHYFDTMKDIIVNTLGAILGLGIFWISGLSQHLYKTTPKTALEVQAHETNHIQLQQSRHQQKQYQKICNKTGTRNRTHPLNKRL